MNNKNLTTAYLDITKPQLISVENYSDSSATFVYGPFAPGYVVTLANSLRRILLASMPGCGIVWIKISNHPHIFSVIDHVQEDIPTIIEQLKLIKFKLNSSLLSSKELLIDVDEIIKANKLENSFVLTSRMIPQNEIIEILNDVPICTINSVQANMDLKITLQIEKGTGYLDPNFTQRSYENITNGCIPVNTPLNSVRKVSFTNPPEKTFYEGSASYELMQISIETDGTITPSEALDESLKTLMKIAQSMRNAGTTLPTPSEHATESQGISDLMERPITDLPIKEAIIKTLHSAGITKISHLCSLTREEALKIPSLGVTKVETIENALKEVGFGGLQADNYNRRKS